VSDRGLLAGITIPLEAARRINRASGADAETYTGVALQAKEPSQVPQLVDTVKRMGLQIDDQERRLSESTGAAVAVTTSALALLSILICALAAVNIAHALFASVRARSKEIGIMRAVGASRADVQRLVLAEAGAVGAIGGLAGTLGAFAALTRVNGMLLIPVMAVEAFMQYRRDGGRFRREWLWILLTSLGFLIYLSINYSVWGDAFYFQKVLEKYWYKKLTWPWVGIGGTLDAAWNRSPAEAHMVGVQEFFFIALGAACTVWAWLRLRPSYAVWMTLNWLLVTSTSHVMSTPRYVLGMFPIFLLFARLADARPNWGAVITLWSLTFLGIFTALFVQGHWAF
jgi:hypothetical protein